MSTVSKPFVGVTGCTHEIKEQGDGDYHIAGNKYLTGLVEGKLQPHP